MAEALSALSLCFIPFSFAAIILYGAHRKAPVYDLFVEGAREGLKTAVDILPNVLAIFIAIEGLSVSGAMGLLQHALEPLCRLLGFPEELVPLSLMRPVSGSASLVLLENLFRMEGPDSFAGRAGAVMMGSCETVFYVLAVYFSATKVKHVRHTMKAGIAGYLAGVAASVVICLYI